MLEDCTTVVADNYIGDSYDWPIGQQTEPVAAFCIPYADCTEFPYLQVSFLYRYQEGS